MYYDVKETAERIRNLRTGSNLTQNEAAEEMGLSLSGYRKLEQGQNGGSIDSLIMVADYYHISLDYLVYGEERDYISSLSEGLFLNFLFVLPFPSHHNTYPNLLIFLLSCSCLSRKSAGCRGTASKNLLSAFYCK